MRRPNRAWCVVILGLAVALGCGKKPAEPAASSAAPETTAAPRPGTTPTAPGRAGGKTQPDAGAGSLWSGIAAGAAGAASVPAPPSAPPSAAPVPAPTPTSTPGAVELTQCRFDKVEAALTAAKGKVVLVDCWARWCPPCISSFPKLVEKHEKYGSKGLVCVSVSLDQGQKRFNTNQVHAFLKEKNATFQNFYLTDLNADNAKMESRFGEISGIPHAVLFARSGAKVWEGHPMAPALVAKLEAELAK